MFIGSEAGREYISQRVALQAGTKTFGAAVRDAWNSTRFEDLSTSRVSALYAEAEELRGRIREVAGIDIANPYITGASATDQAASLRIGAQAGRPDPIDPPAFWDEVDAIAREYPELKTTEGDLIRNIAAKAENLRIKRDSGVVPSGGSLADFIGSTGGLMSDPVNITSMMFGGIAMASARATFAGRLMQAAGREALIGAAAEASIQPYVMKFKEEIGVDYGLGDALSNIAQAGAGGALFAAGGKVAGALAKGGIRKVHASWKDATGQFPDLETPETAAASRAMEDVIAAYDQSPFKEGLEGDAVHEAAMTTAMRQLLAGQPIELRAVFDGLKKIPETKPIKTSVDETGKAVVGDAPIDGDSAAPLDLRAGDEVLTDDGIAALFDAGKEPTRPRDILSIIRDLGGIQPSGELRAMDTIKARPGLVRKAGKSNHEIREHLEEIGMIEPGAGDNEIFDLIDDALRGNDGGVYHPADFDRAVEWEAWRDARARSDLSTEAAIELRDAARVAGRELSADELTDVMRGADLREGLDASAIVGKWLADRPAAGRAGDVAGDPGQGAKSAIDVDWARLIDGAATADDAAAAARKYATRRALDEIDPADIAAIDAEARTRFEDARATRPASEYSPAELTDRLDKIFEDPKKDFAIVDPERFDAEGNPLEVSAREFMARSDDEIEDAALIAQCILNKVA